MASRLQTELARRRDQAVSSRRPFLVLWLVVFILHIALPIVGWLIASVVPPLQPVLERFLKALFWPGLLWGYNWEELMAVAGLLLSVTGWAVVLLPLWLWYRSSQRHSSLVGPAA